MSHSQHVSAQPLSDPMALGPLQQNHSDLRVWTASQEERPRLDYFQRKRVWSRLVGLLMLIPALPLIGVLIAVVRLTSPGPGLFAQKRSGLNGKTFTIYKIRTMRSDAEAKTGAIWSQPGDPRVTTIGRFLRLTHLDELPQLINVVKGEMCLVGPRPERPEFIEKLEEEVVAYRERLYVLPGITGLAQLRLPADTDVEGVRKKTALDLAYIRDGNLLLDIKILAGTVLKVFALSHGTIERICGLHRIAPAERPLTLPAPQERRAA